jgi:phosphatidylglycerol:prolipoprotein diacylglycerol transferase
MLAIAITVAGWLTARDAKARLGIEPDTVYDFVFWVVLLGILGARIFYVLLNWEYFLSEPLEIVMVQKGGLAWQGSLLAGLWGGIVYLKRKKLPLWKFLDIAAPYLALGHAIGRIGCLLNGCCYGKPAAWGIYFPLFEARLIPTQIFMSLGQVTIFLVLRAFQPKARHDGQVFVWYLLLSAVERFVIEFFRADHQLYYGLSVFQYICIVIFLAALVAHERLRKTPRTTGSH